MSTPISACRVYRAALGDEKAFARLVEDMEYNLRWGAFTVFPCQCQPPCTVPTEQQIDDLNKRVTEAVVVLRKQMFGDKKPDKKAPRGDFGKFIAPLVKQIIPPFKIEDILL